MRVVGRIAPATGILAWYQAEPGPGSVAQDVIAGHDGAFYRGTGNTAVAPVYTPAGKVNNAFTFDGSLHVRVPDSPALRPAEVTLEAWIYPIWNNGAFHTVLARGSASNNSNAWSLSVKDGIPYFLTEHQSAPHLLSSAAGIPVVPLYRWTHLAATFDGTKKVLYANGVPVASAIGFDALRYEAASSPVTIGSDWAFGQSSDRFHGRVDEPGIYNRALSESEIAAIADAGAAGKSLAGPFAVELPKAVAGTPYTHQLTFPMGVAPVSYALLAGRLPPGLALATGGLLSGTTPVSGEFVFTVRASDGNAAFQDQVCTLRVLRRTDRPAGLISWWQAENNAQDFIGMNHGTLQNGAGFLAGKVAQAFRFDGVDDCVEIPDAPSLRPTSVTLEAWVMVNVVGVAQVFIAKPLGSGTADSWALYYGNGLNALISGASGPGPVLSAPWSPQPGRWYHVAYVFDDAGDQQRLYLDGALVASGTVTQAIAYDAQPVLIGRDTESGSPNFFLRGGIDEAAIYGRALSSTEIAAIYQADAAGKALPGTGDFEDLNGDGLVNLLAYGLGISSPAASPGAFVFTAENGERYLAINVTRDPAKADVTLTVESSSDLLNWAPIATSTDGAPFRGLATVLGEVTGEAPRVVTILDPYSDPAAPRKGFLRLRVSR